MATNAVKMITLGALAATAPASATGSGSGLDFLQNVQRRGAGSPTLPRVSKQDIWLEDRSAGRLQNTREHLAAPAAFDQWQGFYGAEVAAFSC